MRRVLLYLIIFYSCQMASFGQSNANDTLVTIDQIPYSSEQFLRFSQNQQLLDDKQKQIATKELLDQFVLYQLKLKAARDNNIDKQPEVKRELDIYSDIAFNSFLYPTIVTDEKIVEAFNRIQHYIKVRQILVKINKRATPKDTLEAYTEAKKIQELLQRGKRFEKVAHKYSDDQSVKDNNGEIGYFTAFDMDYSFESAAYQLKIKEYSQPIKTQFGYHIIQVMDKIPNPGKVKIRHILLEHLQSDPTKTKQQIDSLYTILKRENRFDELAKKYSFDRRSADAGGMLPWFGLFETHPLIEKNAFQLQKINDISEPIKTEFGYHILQLIDRKDYSSLEKYKEEISQLIARDGRSKPSSAKLLSNIKKKYQFKENKELLNNFYSILDYAYADLWEPLFTIDGLEYSQEDFAAYLSQQASKDIYENFIEYINRIYNNFSNNSILAFHKKQLLKNNSDLKNLIQNYKNEILIKSITKQKVWIPATNSQFDLLKYYHDNRSKYDENVDFDSIKFKVVSDYKVYLNAIWEQKLRSEYKIEISQSTFNKIAQE